MAQMNFHNIRIGFTTDFPPIPAALSTQASTPHCARRSVRTVPIVPAVPIVSAFSMPDCRHDPVRLLAAHAGIPVLTGTVSSFRNTRVSFARKYFHCRHLPSFPVPVFSVPVFCFSSFPVLLFFLLFPFSPLPSGFAVYRSRAGRIGQMPDAPCAFLSCSGRCTYTGRAGILSPEKPAFSLQRFPHQRSRKNRVRKHQSTTIAIHTPTAPIPHMLPKT